MDWEKLTHDVVAAATAAFSSLMSEKPDERFYAFALYTDEDGCTIMPSANSLEGYETKLRAWARRYGELTERDKANCKWETAEWAYEAWKADLFTGIYRDLEQHRKTLPEDGGTYRTAVDQCMIAALKQMDDNGFFAQGREGIILFVSSSDDDGAFALQNRSARLLNPERIYAPFLERYGADDAES